jgi:ABC-2 type transport system permease protein
MQTVPGQETRIPHRLFSLGRIAAIAGNTLTELTRLKVFYVLLLFALVLIGSSIFMAQFSFQQEFQVLKDTSLGAISFFSSLLAILATARLVPQDLEERTIYTILAKPVPRFEYLTGKLLGVLSLLAISIVVMAALFFAVLYLREQSATAETIRQMSGSPQERVAEAIQGIHAAAFNTNLLPGITIIYLKAALLAALTLFISTFASTSIFTVMVTVFVYFIGHLQATAREFWLQEQGGGWASRTFLAMVALIFPDLQQFNLSDEIVAGAVIPLALFGKTVALGCFYIVLYLLLAVAVFNSKEL